MNDNYIDLIEFKKVNNKLYFNIKDVRLYLCDDYDEIVSKLNKYEISIESSHIGYIDLYSLILLIIFSSDIRCLNYKLFLVYSGISKINDIINPDIVLDRINSIKAMKDVRSFNFLKSNEIPSHYDKNMTDKNILYEEIKFSKDINVIRQII